MTIDEIMKKSERIIGLSVPYDKTRATILAEVHEKLDPIIKIIEDFIASKPKKKQDVYDFLEKQYNPMYTYAYYAWRTEQYVFTNIVMMEIQDEHKVDDAKFRHLYESANIQLMLHNLIWNELTKPLRDKLWNLPRVPCRDAHIKVSDQIMTLRSCKNKLEKILADLEA